MSAASLDYLSSAPRVPQLVTPAGTPLSRRWLIVVALFTATMLLPTLGGRRVLTRHEVFAAEPAREMLQGPAINWVIPHFAGVPRTVKPPTNGWLIAGSMALFHSEAEWVVRLPSALSAILMALLMADLAARWPGTRVAIIAGLMQATFVYVLMQARLAEADMPMAAAVCLAMYAFARGAVDDSQKLGGGGPFAASQTDCAPISTSRAAASSICDAASGTPRAPSRILPILFYLGIGFSFLLKVVGLAFVLAGVAVFIACAVLQGRDWRRCVRFLLNPLGLLLLAIMLLAWPLAAWKADPNILHTFRRELIGRASGEFGERQPWYFYAGVVPVMLMPWLPFGIGAIVEGIRRRVLHGPAVQFLLCWFVPGLLILSTSAWKHHHYVIPMMPPATLAAAAGMELWLRKLKQQKAWIGATLWLIGCAVAAGLVWRQSRIGRQEIVTTIALLAVCGGIASIMIARARAGASIAAVFATAWAVSFAVGFAVIPAFEDYRWSAELAKRANSEVPAGQTIYLLGMGEHNTTFYLRFPIARVDKNVADWFLNLTPGTRYGLCPQSMVPKLKSALNGHFEIDGLPVHDDLWMGYPQIELTELDHAARLHKTETEAERPILIQMRVIHTWPVIPAKSGGF